MIEEWIDEEKDPDYREFHKKVVIDRAKLQEEDTKNKTVDKIEVIVKSQFRIETEAKEHEISVISGRINDCKVMLDRLRAYVVASYFGSGENIIPTTKAVPSKKRKPTDEKLHVDDNPVLIKKQFQEKFPDSKLWNSTNIDHTDDNNRTVTEQKPQCIPEATVINRFYVTHKVIVGNVSKYLGNENRKENDKSTHKWMVYVRGPSDSPDISTYVKSVWFFLHPSYIPNDIIQIHKAPFQLTRRGWGEFPVRVQLHFKDSRSKRFDIIHHLKLDKTYTGLQTLGAETVVHLELHRHTKDGHLVVNTTSNCNGDGNYEPLTKPITELLCDAPIATSKNQTSNGCVGLVSPSGSRTSVKNELINLLNHTSINGHVDNDMKIEQCGINSSNLSLLNRKKDEQLKLIPISSSRQSVVSSCVTSASTSRCCSPVTPSNVSKCFIFDDETDLILRRLVTSARLICPNEKLRFRAFTCPSLEQYKEWSFSKRRASEWQRAAFMRKLFCKHTEADKQLSLPSTKQIMIWCRKNGYTPPEKKLKVITGTDQFVFCYFCGVIYEPDNSTNVIHWCTHCTTNVHIARDSFNTMTSYQTMLNSVRLKEETLKSLDSLESDKNDENEYVDIITVGDKPTLKEQVDVEILSSKELDWVYETANTLGIHLPTLTMNCVKGPFLQAMLLTATKCFLSELLRKSYSNTGEMNKTTLEPSMITYNHIFKSIRSTVKFDFLTDAYMGKMEGENVEGLNN